MKAGVRGGQKWHITASKRLVPGHLHDMQRANEAYPKRRCVFQKQPEAETFPVRGIIQENCIGLIRALLGSPPRTNQKR